jgi:hypothetical protein
MLFRLIRKPICVLAFISASSSSAAEITACDLVDKEMAGQIIGRPVAREPNPLRNVVADKTRKDCHFSAEGVPVAVVTVTLWEFKSSSDAKAWADKANTPRVPSGSTEIERSMGDVAVWWTGENSAGYLVRKGVYVLEIYIRSAARSFEVTPSMRQQFRRAAMRATEKI